MCLLFRQTILRCFGFLFCLDVRKMLCVEIYYDFNYYTSVWWPDWVAVSWSPPLNDLLPGRSLWTAFSWSPPHHGLLSGRSVWVAVSWSPPHTGSSPVAACVAVSWNQLHNGFLSGRTLWVAVSVSVHRTHWLLLQSQAGWLRVEVHRTIAYSSVAPCGWLSGEVHLTLPYSPVKPFGWLSISTPVSHHIARRRSSNKI